MITRKFKIVESSSVDLIQIVPLICDNRFVHKAELSSTDQLERNKDLSFVWYANLTFENEKNLTAYLMSDTTINQILKSITLVEEEL